ncbi:hypothetical protein DV515_00016314 [Chloebia gouldiae]|uniref:Uncharacterized protein n=1 Tax=Chloebia gouldiae TaxID=44316 RepID=A0A3L8RTE1_CHLGU|nr:hypothetical protein DV515_00016314 [Chloebia gouldiae]
MPRTGSPEGWCGRGVHAVGPASGPGAGGGPGGPGPGSRTRAPCPSEPGLPPAFHGHGFHCSRRVLARSAHPPALLSLGSPL